MMNKKEAIEFLKNEHMKISQLTMLPYSNKEYPVWRNVIIGVLDEVFEKESYEYDMFVNKTRKVGFVGLAQQEYRDALNRYDNALLSIIQKHEILGIEEKSVVQEGKGELESPVDIFDKMQLHPRIIRASKSLFHSRHYAEAIFAAFKAVNNFTKRKTGQSLDGKDLMAKVFNEDKPIIKLNKLVTRSERDEQEGFRFLYMGAMVGIRNPKAHDDIRQIDPFKALEYLAFASLLMRRVIEGKLEPKEPPIDHQTI
ncbi:TIGR02391 family protein [Chloroflexota bacterium]